MEVIDFTRATTSEATVLTAALTLYEDQLRQRHRDTRSTTMRDDVKWRRHVAGELLAAIDAR